MEWPKDFNKKMLIDLMERDSAHMSQKSVTCGVLIFMEWLKRLYQENVD